MKFEFACPDDPSSCSYKSLTLKRGVYLLKLYGASGGCETSSSLQNIPGKGGFAQGVLTLLEKKILYLYIGGKGMQSIGNILPGGWNGGGAGTQSGGSGGGATDIRTIPGDWNNEESLKSRIIVAAGGGGAYRGATHHSDGGDGGGLEGNSTNKYMLNSETYSEGVFACYGTQTGCEGTELGIKGEFGKGASGNGYYYSGGGGGYWGGGSNERASGGGSSFVGNLSYAFTKPGVNEGNGRIIIERISLGQTCKIRSQYSKNFVVICTFLIS